MALLLRFSFGVAKALRQAVFNGGVFGRSVVEPTVPRVPVLAILPPVVPPPFAGVDLSSLPALFPDLPDPAEESVVGVEPALV